MIGNHWSIINGAGATVADSMPLEVAAAYLTPERFERGWIAVCCIATAEQLADMAGGLDAAQIDAYSEGRKDESEAAVVPTGWQLVPIEPTPKMARAGDDYATENSQRAKGMWWWSRLYQAMIAAAPQPTP
jgi:hypothetical protein